VGPPPSHTKVLRRQQLHRLPKRDELVHQRESHPRVVLRPRRGPTESETFGPVVRDQSQRRQLVLQTGEDRATLKSGVIDSSGF
jgi:hypothetical protein